MSVETKLGAYFLPEGRGTQKSATLLSPAGEISVIHAFPIPYTFGLYMTQPGKRSLFDEVHVPPQDYSQLDKLRYLSLTRTATNLSGATVNILREGATHEEAFAAIYASLEQLLSGAKDQQAAMNGVVQPSAVVERPQETSPTVAIYQELSSAVIGVSHLFNRLLTPESGEFLNWFTSHKGEASVPIVSPVSLHTRSTDPDEIDVMITWEYNKRIKNCPDPYTQEVHMHGRVSRASFLADPDLHRWVGNKSFDAVWLQAYSRTFDPGKGGVKFDDTFAREFFQDIHLTRILIFKDGAKATSLGCLDMRGKLHWFFLWFPNG